MLTGVTWGHWVDHTSQQGQLSQWGTSFSCPCPFVFFTFWHFKVQVGATCLYWTVCGRRASFLPIRSDNSSPLSCCVVSSCCNFNGPMIWQSCAKLSTAFVHGFQGYWAVKCFGAHVTSVYASSDALSVDLDKSLKALRASAPGKALLGCFSMFQLYLPHRVMPWYVTWLFWLCLLCSRLCLMIMIHLIHYDLIWCDCIPRIVLPRWNEPLMLKLIKVYDLCIAWGGNLHKTSTEILPKGRWDTILNRMYFRRKSSKQ